MSIKKWPKTERPREKLLSQGAESLSDAELLAIILRTGTQGKTVIDLARQLLIHFGNLTTLFHTDFETLRKQKGLGMSKYVQLKAVLELGRRCLSEKLQKTKILTNSKITKEFLLSKLAHRPHETFACLLLNSKNQLINYKELFNGSIDRTVIYPREIAKTALYYNATSIILAHNHPSGDPTPSQTDIDLSLDLQKSLSFIDIRLLDHIIIGYNTAYSLTENGIL